MLIIHILSLSLFLRIKFKTVIMKLFIIDGNIGSGKSTFLKHLQTVFPDVVTIQEPVDEWFKLKNEQGVSLFELFYNDPVRYSYLFQTNILYTRFNKIKTLMEPTDENKNKIVVCERSIMTDLNVFVEAARDLGNLSSIEYEVFVNWYNMLVDLSNFRVDGVIYIRCGPDISMERIQKRNRTGESGISFEYLKLLHEKHEQWLMSEDDDKQSVFVIDGTKDISELTSDSDLHSQLQHFVLH